jgi:glycine/D-amino acid oxidase-like deaminating enzyme/nitrite reductase/ring-hydroxylating ferredoxin subunit
MAVAPIDRCYWTANFEPQPFGAHDGELQIDIAIIGAGIVGTIAARLLKDRGKTVALVESGQVGAGVTGRSTAKVTAQHSVFLQRVERDHGSDAARAYAAANAAGVGLIKDLVQRYQLACDLEPADSYVYATTADGVRQLERERDAAERAGLPMLLVEETDLPYPVKGALRLAGQAQFQPASFVAELARTLPGDGSFVLDGSHAADWGDDFVETKAGRIRADHVIMATHLPLGGVGQFYSHTSPHMHAVMAVPIDAARAPVGMYVSVDEPKRSLRSHRSTNGETMLILTGPRFTHGNANEEAGAFSQLEEFAREQFGWAGGGYRWSNEDYTAADGLPYVGWSGAEGQSLLVATGFDAWGLSNGAAAAMMLADLCEGRKNAWASCFDASRHSLKGVGKVAAAAAQAVRGLVGDHLHKQQAEVSPLQEGTIVYTGGRAAGLYRDSDGVFRAVSAVCTHMGCMLGWNPVDRTWDCRCHGSRFAADGRVLHGPAVEPLSVIERSGDANEE